MEIPTLFIDYVDLIKNPTEENCSKYSVIGYMNIYEKQLLKRRLQEKYRKKSK